MKIKKKQVKIIEQEFNKVLEAVEAKFTKEIK